jgi:hypothetical protein
MEYLLYGLTPGESRNYMESLLTVTTDLKRIEHIKTVATEKGFTNLRVATYNNEAPDFLAAIA